MAAPGCRTTTRTCCTSGFAVTTLGGTTGVSTAAHCSGLDQYNPPNGDPDFSITFQGQHLGIFGDVQWQTTVDPRAGRVLRHRDTEIRSQDSGSRAVERHLRQQLVLRLRPLVQQPPVRRGVLRLRECHLGGSFISSLVGMTEDNTIGGDSGGPWSYGTEAVGGHRGDQWIWFKYRNVFSVADLFPVALGVFGADLPRTLVSTPRGALTDQYRVPARRQSPGDQPVARNWAASASRFAACARLRARRRAAWCVRAPHATRAPAPRPARRDRGDGQAAVGSGTSRAPGTSRPSNRARRPRACRPRTCRCRPAGPAPAGPGTGSDAPVKTCSAL